MSIPFIPQIVPILGPNDQMADDWYDYFQDAYQLAGLAGSQNPLWERVVAAGTAVTVDSTSPPTQVTVSGVIEGWSFPTGVTSRAHAVLVMPNRYVGGSEWHPFVQWMPDDATNGSVRWEFDYLAVDADSAAGAVTQVALQDAAAGTALTNQYVEGEKIEDSGLRIGSAIICSITRDGGDVADTYGGDAILLGVGVKCMIGGVGTVTRWEPGT